MCRVFEIDWKFPRILDHYVLKKGDLNVIPNICITSKDRSDNDYIIRMTFGEAEDPGNGHMILPRI